MERRSLSLRSRRTRGNGCVSPVPHDISDARASVVEFVEAWRTLLLSMLHTCLLRWTYEETMAYLVVFLILWALNEAANARVLYRM